jgi:tetratricopeptide (TPR) repeat protein
MHFARLYTEKYPNDSCGWLVLADALGSIAKYEEARKALRVALKLSPKDDREFVFHQIGHFYKEKGDFRRAESWYRRAVQTEATTNNLVFLGACLARQGRYKEAKQSHRRAIQLATREPDEAYFNLGLILRAEGKYQEALECFERALEFDPKYVIAKKAKNDILTLFKITRRV